MYCWVDRASFPAAAWRSRASNPLSTATFCTIAELLKPFDHGALAKNHSYHTVSLSRRFLCESWLGADIFAVRERDSSNKWQIIIFRLFIKSNVLYKANMLIMNWFFILWTVSIANLSVDAQSVFQNERNRFKRERPGRVAQSAGHLTRKSGVLGSIPGRATYFRFSFRFFKKGSCQLLAKVCARSTG